MVKITPILGGNLVGCCALDGMGNVKNNANVSDKTCLSVTNIDSICRQGKGYKNGPPQTCCRIPLIAKDNHNTLRKFVGGNSWLSETYLAYLLEQTGSGLPLILLTWVVREGNAATEWKKREIEAI